MRVYGFCAVALVLASLPVAALAIVTNASPSPGAPVRHLVYSFTWGATTDLETHTSGFADETGAMKSPGAPSGIASSTAGTQDQGTITVDVEREQPDRGLVVDISEQANGRRSAPSATCVVFGNTHIICDPNKKINAEELTLLRFLGSNFVDATQLDSKQHWQTVQSTPPSTATSDYTIAKNDSGIMTIDEARVVTYAGARPLTTTVNSTIGYDFNRTIPVSVHEYSIERREHAEQYQTVKSETVLQLRSDSLAVKTP